MVLKKGSRCSNQRLPKKLKHIVFLNVLSESEHSEVAKERFDVANDAAFFGIGFDYQIEPTALEIEFAVGERQVVYRGDIQTEQAQSEMKCGAIRERIERHLEIELCLVHHHSGGLDSGHERIGFMANISEVINRGVDM